MLLSAMDVSGIFRYCFESISAKGGIYFLTIAKKTEQIVGSSYQNGSRSSIIQLIIFYNFY